jgi:hypothetical protein
VENQWDRIPLQREHIHFRSRGNTFIPRKQGGLADPVAYSSAQNTLR